MSDPNAPAGWYPDVYDETRQRYWDGDAWTDHYSPIAATQPATVTLPVAMAYNSAAPMGAPRAPGSGRRLAVVLVIVGVLAVAAIITAIVLVNRENQRREAVASFCSAYSFDSYALTDAAYAYDTADAFVEEIVATATISLQERDSIATQLEEAASRVQDLYFIASHEFIPFEEDLGTLSDELTESAAIIRTFDVGKNTFSMQDDWDYRAFWAEPDWIDSEAISLCGWGE